jgi:hypothetical protein
MRVLLSSAAQHASRSVIPSAIKIMLCALLFEIRKYTMDPVACGLLSRGSRLALLPLTTRSMQAAVDRARGGLGNSRPDRGGCRQLAAAAAGVRGGRCW